MNSSEGGINEIARLVALAERCASEGQMNLNRLLEAAVFAEIRRVGWRYSPKITARDMLPQLRVSLQALKQGDVDPGLVAALEAGSRALASPASLAYRAAPRVRAANNSAPGRLPGLP